MMSAAPVASGPGPTLAQLKGRCPTLSGKMNRRRNQLSHAAAAAAAATDPQRPPGSALSVGGCHSAPPGQDRAASTAGVDAVIRRIAANDAEDPLLALVITHLMVSSAVAVRGLCAALQRNTRLLSVAVTCEAYRQICALEEEEEEQLLLSLGRRADAAAAAAAAGGSGGAGGGGRASGMALASVAASAATATTTTTPRPSQLWVTLTRSLMHLPLRSLDFARLGVLRSLAHAEAIVTLVAHTCGVEAYGVEVQALREMGTGVGSAAARSGPLSTASRPHTTVYRASCVSFGDMPTAAPTPGPEADEAAAGEGGKKQHPADDENKEKEEAEKAEGKREEKEEKAGSSAEASHEASTSAPTVVPPATAAASPFAAAVAEGKGGRVRAPSLTAFAAYAEGTGNASVTLYDPSAARPADGAGSGGAAAAAAAPTFPSATLASLSVSGVRGFITPDGLAHSPNQREQPLAASQPAFAAVAHRLSRCLFLPGSSLQAADLSHCGLGDSGALAVMDVFLHEGQRSAMNLRWLSLAWNGLTRAEEVTHALTAVFSPPSNSGAAAPLATTTGHRGGSAGAAGVATASCGGTATGAASTATYRASQSDSRTSLRSPLGPDGGDATAVPTAAASTAVVPSSSSLHQLQLQQQQHCAAVCYLQLEGNHVDPALHARLRKGCPPS